MRGMNKSIILAAAARVAAYAATSSQILTMQEAGLVIDGAFEQTTKAMAASRTRGGGTVYVPAGYVDRSKYMPHQNEREMARRVRQMEA